jgi:hypothetical protein
MSLARCSASPIWAIFVCQVAIFSCENFGAVAILHRLDAAFFRVGESRDGLLVKFYAGEEYSEGELLSDFEENGLEARRLKREGQLLMRSEEEPLGGTRADQLGRLIEEEGGEGSTVWASFNWVRPVELETALEQQKQLTELVDASQLVVKTAAIEEAIDEWMPSELRRVQSAHSAIILASEGGAFAEPCYADASLS